MIQQEISTGSRIIVSTEKFVVFAPFASRFPFEAWVLPKAHNSHFENLQEFVIKELADVLKNTLFRLESVLDFPPYNYVIHTSPFNMADNEYFHWHIEIIPRLTNIAGFEWGAGFYINSMLPEKAAGFLRNTDLGYE